MSAKMIPVLTITDAILTSSTIAEPDAGDGAAWAAGTTYALAATVSKNHVNYESVQAGNLGNDPETDDGTWWTAGLATNRWGVFDGYLQNQTTQANSATWVITPGTVVNSVSFFNMAAAEVTIIVTDPTDGEVYNETFPLVDNDAVIDAYTYFLSPIVTKSNFCVTDIPPYAAAAISITVTETGGTVSVGQISLGYYETLGETIDEVPLGIDDYTRLNEDAFGRTSPAIRGYARTAAASISVDASRVPYLERLLAGQRGTPTVWAFDTQFSDSELVYIGYYENYSFEYQYASKNILDLEIRSLV